MTASARLEVTFPLEDLVAAGLDAPEGSQWRTPPFGADVNMIDGQDIGPFGRALRWVNDMDDRIEAALAEFGCKHADSGSGGEYYDIGYDLDVERRDEARQRLLDVMAANPAIPADTSLSIVVFADDSFEKELDSWSSTVGEYRASLARDR